MLPLLFWGLQPTPIAHPSAEQGRAGQRQLPLLGRAALRRQPLGQGFPADAARPRHRGSTGLEHLCCVGLEPLVLPCPSAAGPPSVSDTWECDSCAAASLLGKRCQGSSC